MSDSPKLFASIKRLGASAASLATSRLQLLSIELAEEKDRLVGLLVLAVIAAVLGVVGFIVVTLGLVWLFGPENRALALFAVGAFYLFIAIAIGLVLKSHLAAQPTPFAATIRELEQDRDTLKASLAAETAPASPTQPS